MTTILFAIWCFVGMVVLGLARIKTPQDTLAGKAEPIEAAIAWTLMLVCWPLTLWNRRRFALYGDPRDKDNPSWLAEGRDRQEAGDRSQFSGLTTR